MWSLIAVVVLSCVVYGHHMFTTGMSPLLGESFMVLTMIISVPTSLLFLNWLGTLWRGAARMTTPMLFCVGLVFTFGIGGLTGLYLADIVADMYLHDTYFVVGHFHLIMAAALLLASFAAIYFWFPKMFGRMMSERLGKLHFWPTFISLNLVFVGQLLIGYAGMQRRLYDPSAYEFLRHLLPLEQAASRTPPTCWGRSQLVFVWNFFYSLRARQAGARQPVAGRHAGVDGGVAAAAPQLRSHPGRRARPARARQSRRRSRAARTGWRRTRSSDDGREAQSRSKRDIDASVGMADLPGHACAMLFAALLLAYAVCARRRRPGRRPARRRSRAPPRAATACCCSPPASRCAARDARPAAWLRGALARWASLFLALQVALWRHLVAGQLGPGTGRWPTCSSRCRRSTRCTWLGGLVAIAARRRSRAASRRCIDVTGTSSPCVWLIIYVAVCVL